MLYVILTMIILLNKLNGDQDINQTPFVRNEDSDAIFVSLGSFCGPALKMKDEGLRPYALPFDWILSVDGNMIIECLIDDFKFFCDSSFFRKTNGGVLLHDYYHLEFSHEGNCNAPEFDEGIEKMIDKYQRRIERFRSLRDSDVPLVFIRSSWSLSTHANYHFPSPDNLELTQEYAFRLYNELCKYFHKNKIFLIILNPQLNSTKMEVMENIIFSNTSNLSLKDIKNRFLIQK